MLSKRRFSPEGSAFTPRTITDTLVHSIGEIKAGLQVGHVRGRGILLYTFYTRIWKDTTMALIRSERNLARGPSVS